MWSNILGSVCVYFWVIEGRLGCRGWEVGGGWIGLVYVGFYKFF